MPRPPDSLNLDVDLDGGVVPISKVASALAALIKRGWGSERKYERSADRFAAAGSRPLRRTPIHRRGYQRQLVPRRLSLGARYVTPWWPSAVLKLVRIAPRLPFAYFFWR